MTKGDKSRLLIGLCVLSALALNVPLASAQAAPAPAACAGAGECLCDNSYQDCRTPLLALINKETQAIAVSMWFMTDYRYRDALVKRKNAGVDVRVIVDTQADTNYPANKTERELLIKAGIPVRDCISSKGINHWKAMIFKGLGKVQFSAANFATGSFSPYGSPTTVPYVTYVDEAIYFTDDDSVVRTFMRRFDEHWMNTTEFRNLWSFPLDRLFENSDQFALDPDLNFVPYQYFEDRLRTQVALEDRQKNAAAAIDAVMFRITSGKIPDALIARKRAGVPVRLITDARQYRNTTYFWHAYNIDRMYAEGIAIKWKDKTLTDQDMHQKSIILHTRGAATPAPMVVFGSSNWTSSSNSGQREHNYFTRKPWMVDWFMDQFDRKWNNLKVDGSPIGQSVFDSFVPAYPETPVISAPANGATGVSTTVTLKWEGGWWAHKYDIFLSESPAVNSSGVMISPPIAVDYMPGSATAGVKSTKESLPVSGLKPGTTYYWQIRGKTMANRTKISPKWSFRTAGAP
jgi:phosphatidylserine/phosphatidylglycerophosphate/cardiolipin synthase-like enzyme